MSPLRIIILAILFYIGYRLLVGGRKKKTSDRIRRDTASREMPTDDILEEDPVCNKLVPRHYAVEYQHHGKTYYFCSKECCDTYRTQQGEHQ
ncbi:MAG: YHS domain-containing protein [Desulforhopalus sp.]